MSDHRLNRIHFRDLSRTSAKALPALCVLPMEGPCMKSGSVPTVEFGMAALDHSSLAAAVEQAADGVVITDTEGAMQYVNPAFTAMTGFTAEEALGQNLRVMKSGRHPAAFYEEMWSTIRSGKIWHGE